VTTAVVAPTRNHPQPRRLALVLIAVCAAVVVLMFPARAYLDQRAEIARTTDRVAEVERANTRLRERQTRLADPNEVQHSARREFGLVGVGEESYSILPPLTAGLVLPNAWPFDRIAAPLERAAART